MAAVRDTYELAGKASLGAIRSAVGVLGGLRGGLQSIAKLGNAPFKAAQAGLASLTHGLGIARRGLSVFSVGLRGISNLARTFSSGLESVRKTSPAFAQQMGRLESRITAVKTALGRRVGNALAPMIASVVKALDSPKV